MPGVPASAALPQSRHTPRTQVRGAHTDDQCIDLMWLDIVDEPSCLRSAESLGEGFRTIKTKLLGMKSGSVAAVISDFHQQLCSEVSRAVKRLQSTGLRRSPSLSVANERCLGQREQYDFFAGGDADVMMQTHHLDAGNLCDHRFEDRPRCFNELGPDLFQKISSFLRRVCLDEMLLRGREHTLQSDDKKVADEVCVYVFRSPAHVILLEACDPLTNGRFEFSLRFHGEFLRLLRWHRKPPVGH